MKRLALLGLLAASLCTLAMAKPAQGYRCPSYSRICSRNTDCRGYCGPGVPAEWEVCVSGCCACAG